jgi:hypothetical protein
MTTTNSGAKPPPPDESDKHSGPASRSGSPALGLPQSIAGVIRAVPGEVSPEERAAAKRMLKTIKQIRSRLPEAPGGGAHSPPEDASTAASIGAKLKRAKLDDVLAPGLADSGYRKVAKLTYRGEWSTPEIEHVLTFETYGLPKDFLRGDAGLRNRAAEAFAAECLQRYANRGILRALRDSGYKCPPWFCDMHFSIGDLFDWESRGSIDMTDYSSDELAHTVTELARSKLVPFVRNIVSIPAFLEILERDDQPMTWVRTGGGRFAIVAYLAAAVGADRAKTRATLLKHVGLIKTWVDRPRLTPETYIERILDDAAAAVAAERIAAPKNPQP